MKKTKPYQVIVEWALLNQSCSPKWETHTGGNARKEAMAKLREIAADPNNVNPRVTEYWSHSCAVEAK